MRDVSQNWNDWAIKNVWNLVKHKSSLRKYLPAEDIDLGSYPDRKFFWALLSQLFHFGQTHIMKLSSKRNVKKLLKIQTTKRSLPSLMSGEKN